VVRKGQRRGATSLAAVAFAASVLGCESGSLPTWSADIAPLVGARCAHCHRTGGAAFSLETYDAVRANGGAIAYVTSERIMPPWPPSGREDCLRLEGDRDLSQLDIDRIGAWVRAGMPEGEPSVRVPESDAFGTLDGVSVVLGPEEPYTPKVTEDDYRCFLVDPKLASDAFITAYRVDAGPGVHHIQLWEIDDESTVVDVMKLDAESKDPGIACEDWPSASMRYLTVWGPGDPVRRHPAGTGIRVHGGKKLYYQVHYHRGAPADRTSVGLVLADHIDEEATMLALAAQGFVLPPYASETSVHAELSLPGDARLWGVRAHMHRLGSVAHIGWRAPASGAGASDPQCLLDIPRWDATWQLMYFYPQAIQLNAGDLVNLDCTYDTRGVNQMVKDGPASTDEMCWGYLYVTGLPTL
jgi:hypothetical protein